MRFLLKLRFADDKLLRGNTLDETTLVLHPRLRVFANAGAQFNVDKERNFDTDQQSTAIRTFSNKQWYESLSLNRNLTLPKKKLHVDG